MGSHGAQPRKDQREVLTGYGITEATMGVPIQASMEVRQIGTSADGAPVWCSVEALAPMASCWSIVSSLTPTSVGTLGSGVVKMCVVGLGKHIGAAAMHATASRVGHETGHSRHCGCSPRQRSDSGRGRNPRKPTP
jgi:hypothetical protein